MSEEHGKRVSTLADVQALFEAIKTNQPEYFPVSPKAIVQLWRIEQLRKLYTDVVPKPATRQLRKSKMRRIQARLQQGRRRIVRRERTAEKLRKLLGDLADATMNMPPLSSRTVIMHIEYKGRGEPLPFDF